MFLQDSDSVRVWLASPLWSCCSAPCSPSRRRGSPGSSSSVGSSRGTPDADQLAAADRRGYQLVPSGRVIEFASLRFVLRAVQTFPCLAICDSREPLSRFLERHAPEQTSLRYPATGTLWRRFPLVVWSIIYVFFRR